jgi:predicted ATPase
VFVTGDPGVGKTTVVDLFLERVRTSGEVWIGRGQCLEQYGEGEAYLPVLEALGQLCRGPGGKQALTVLQRYAPTWVVQMPALVAEAELDSLQRKVAGVTRERMVREMAEALEALTAERGLVLVVEDLHVSDYSTVELIAYLAQRREQAKLLVIGTHRPAEVVLREHPLRGIKQELSARGQCAELRLELLSQAAVEEYVAKRLVAGVVPPELTTLIYQRTDGNALFMVNVLEYCLRQNLVAQEEGQWKLKVDAEKLGVPESVQQMIAKQIERLTEHEQHVLELASVAGNEFTVASVAAALQSRLCDCEHGAIAVYRGVGRRCSAERCRRS